MTELSWEQYKRRLYLAVALIAFLILLATFVSATVNVLLMFFLCILIAIGVRGISDGMAQQTPLSRSAALVLVIFVFLAVIVAASMVIGPQLGEQFRQLGQRLPDALQQVEQQLRQSSWGQQLADEIPTASQLGQQVLGGNTDILAQLTGIVSSVLNLVTSVIVVFFITLFIAFDPQIYVESFLRLVPQNRREHVRATLNTVEETLEQWLLLRLVSMILIGTLTFIGLSIIGMPLTLSLAAIAGIGAFIPTFGPVLALIPAFLVAFSVSGQHALYVTALYIGVQMIDNYIISPLLQKSMLYLPPAYILAAQLFFGVIAGPLGLLLAAPLAAALVVVVRMLYVEDVLEDKQRESAGRG